MYIDIKKPATPEAAEAPEPGHLYTLHPQYKKSSCFYGVIYLAHKRPGKNGEITITLVNTKNGVAWISDEGFGSSKFIDVTERYKLVDRDPNA